MTLCCTPRPAFGVKVTGSLPCWACLAAGPFSRAGPAVPQAPRSHPRGPALWGPGGAESVLSPGAPAPVLSPRRLGASAPRRLGCPGTQVHPSRRHPLRTTATPARSSPPTPRNGAHVRQPSPGRQPSRRQRQPVLAARPHARQPSSVMRRSTGASRDSTACRICHASTEPDLTRQPKPASPARPGSRSDRPGTSSVPIQAPCHPSGCALCHPSDCRRPATRRHPPGTHLPPRACPGPRMKRAATPLGSGRRSWQSCLCRPSFHGNRFPRSLPSRPPNRRRPRPPNRWHRPPTEQLRLPRQNR